MDHLKNKLHIFVVRGADCTLGFHNACFLGFLLKSFQLRYYDSIVVYTLFIIIIL